MDTETKSIVRSLVASTPLKSTIRSILKDYYDTVGFELPFRQLGFSNPEQYFRSIPDVVQIVGNGPNAEIRQVHSQKLDHINHMVARQRIPKPKINRRRPPSRSKIVAPPPQNTNEFVSTTIPSSLSSNYYQNINRQPKCDNRFRSTPQQQKQSKPLLESKSESLPVEQTPTEFFTPTASSTLSEQPKLNISPYMKKYMEKPLLSVEDDNAIFYDEVEERVPEHIRNNLRDLIGDHPEGVWCCDLPKLYKSRYLVELDYTAYKFRTLNEMCLYLASIFHYVRPNKGDFKLYDKRSAIPHDLSLGMYDEIKEEDCNEFKIADDLELLSLESLGFSDEPTNVVQYLEDIPRQWLSNQQKEGSFIDVWIAEVYDPSKFWFILNKPQLDNMMNEMQTYYTANKHKYEIPPHKLKEGLFCSAILFSEYHRAVVVAKCLASTDDKVKLYFIDYGTVCKVPVKGICYLHQKFAVMPQQALRGRLAGIYPPCAQQQWSTDVCSRFFNLVAEKSLVAKIEKINLQKQCIHLTLFETQVKGSLDPPIDINEVLINEGFAVASPEAQKAVEMSKYVVPKVSHLHLYPTFEEIEQGLVPSAPEMKNLLSNGCSLEFIYPQYFQITYYKQELQKLRTKMSDSCSLEDTDSFDAKSTSSSTAATDDFRSSTTDEMINFTRDLILDKGGTSSSEIDIQENNFQHSQLNLKPPLPHSINMEEKEQHLDPPSSKSVVAEGVISKPQWITDIPHPPPGFEHIRPMIAVQQNLSMPPPQYCNNFPPFVQQNYYFSTYPPQYYQMPPLGFAPRLPYNYYQPQAEPYNPPPPSAHLETVVNEYLNCLRNSTVVEVEKIDNSDSDVIDSGTLIEKHVNDVQEEKIQIEPTEIVKDKTVEHLTENINIGNKPSTKEIEETAKKKRKRRKQKTSSSEQSESEFNQKQTSFEQKQNDSLKIITNNSDCITVNFKTKEEQEALTAIENDVNIENDKPSKNMVVTEKVTFETNGTIESENTKTSSSPSKTDHETGKTKNKKTQDRAIANFETENGPTKAKFENQTEEYQSVDIENIKTNQSNSLIQEDICLLDASEKELVTLLSRPGSRSDSELDALEKFLFDNTKPLQPQILTNVQQQMVAELKPQKYVERKVIAGKSISIVTWEEKRYVVHDEILKSYSGQEMPITKAKIQLHRRNIFLKDINVNSLEPHVQEEFMRYGLVTTNKFGKFVHLLQLEQLPKFVDIFCSGVKINIGDVL